MPVNYTSFFVLALFFFLQDFFSNLPTSSFCHLSRVHTRVLVGDETSDSSHNQKKPSLCQLTIWKNLWVGSPAKMFSKQKLSFTHCFPAPKARSHLQIRHAIQTFLHLSRSFFCFCPLCTPQSSHYETGRAPSPECAGVNALRAGKQSEENILVGKQS